MVAINASIMNVCNEVSQVAKPETIDIVVAILKSQWRVLGLSFLVVPIVVYTLLFLLVGRTGKIDRWELWLLNIVLFIISIMIGTVMYLLLGVHTVPFING